jgi:LacI family transcriptional regulator
MKTTQKEIAKRTGVSQCTVSHVLRGINNNNVRRETVEKILFVAGDMGYKKRFVPAEGSTKNIGYLIPQKSIQGFITDPYYARFVSGLTDYSRDHNYSLGIYNDYAHLMQAVLNSKIEGLVVESQLSAEETKTIAKHIPVVLLNWNDPAVDVDSVVPNNAGGIEKAVMRLFALGHRNIAFFSMRPFSINAEERLKGYYDGLKGCGLEAVPEYVHLPEAKRRGMKEIEEYAMQALRFWRGLGDKPTALVTAGDGYALSFIRVAHKSGIRIPEEFSITGFDNRVSCLYSSPSLTSIEQPMEEMAEKAMTLLHERIKKPYKPIENVVINVELIERESICENRRKL